MEVILNSKMYDKDRKLNLINALELEEIKKIFNGNIYENLKDQEIIKYLLDKFGIDTFYTDTVKVNFTKLNLENFRTLLHLLKEDESYNNFIKANFEFLHIYYGDETYHKYIIEFFKVTDYINCHLINMSDLLFSRLIKNEDFLILLESTKLVNNMTLFDFLCLSKKKFDLKLVTLIENGIFNKESFNKTPFYADVFFALQEK